MENVDQNDDWNNVNIVTGKCLFLSWHCNLDPNVDCSQKSYHRSLIKSRSISCQL